MGRDPRVEPRAGDVLRKHGNTRTVTAAYDTKTGAPRVAFTLTFAGEKEPLKKRFTESYRDWRAYAHTATIIHVAEG